MVVAEQLHHPRLPGDHRRQPMQGQQASYQEEHRYHEQNCVGRTRTLIDAPEQQRDPCQQQHDPGSQHPDAGR